MRPYATRGWNRAVYGQGLPYPYRGRRKCGDGKPSPYSGTVIDGLGDSQFCQISAARRAG
jgi:hypothetical protein